MSDGDIWHQVQAQREDGIDALFVIREVEPRTDQPRIFVIEMPYKVTELSRLPDAAAYRRLHMFQEQWVEPACSALGWTFVAWKSEDGSFFLYLYGGGEPQAMLEKLAPFDGALGFFDDADPEWNEYAALRELLEQAQAVADEEPEPEPEHAHNGTNGHAHEHAGDITSVGMPAVKPAKKKPKKKPAAKKKPVAKKKPAAKKKKPLAKKPAAKKKRARR